MLILYTEHRMPSFWCIALYQTIVLSTAACQLPPSSDSYLAPWEYPQPGGLHFPLCCRQHPMTNFHQGAKPELFLFCFILWCWVQPPALHIPGKCSTTELSPQPYFLKLLYWGTLWHLQNLIQYIIAEFTPSIILLYPPSFHSWNSFNRSHFSTYIHVYRIFPTYLPCYLLSLYPFSFHWYPLPR
jgi:hypothetical protein